MLNTLFVGLVTVKPLFVGNRISFEKMNVAIEFNNLKPVLDKVFTFEEVEKGYEYFAK
ncbi:MAG: hypothetical protein H7Y03_08345 [Chitinophagaceae bacterium]|nr:hypothetical protein [Chitinophagaceae bacterium]